jgi:soluble calcium-activated nucleotidase 1
MSSTTTTKKEDVKRLERYDENTTDYRIAIITDEDQASKIEWENGEVAWRSTLRYDAATRHIDTATGRPYYEFRRVPDEEGGSNQLFSIIAEGDRGAEFSELCLFGQRILAFDDRTGLVCEIRDNHNLIPRQILMTGCGDEEFKGFKCEWATMKGDQLIIGSHGRNEVEKGKPVTGSLEWVKVLNKDYGIQSKNWHEYYERMRQALDIDSRVGYITHEAVEWHPFYQQWYLFPRKISWEAFDEDKDERERSTNIMLIANEDFTDISTVEVGKRKPDRGVSSFKFVPGHTDECIGLKSVEKGEITATYIFAFDIYGNMLSDEIFLGDYKCEGAEIV